MYSVCVNFYSLLPCTPLSTAQMYFFNVWSLRNWNHYSAIIWCSFCFVTLLVLKRFCYNQKSLARNCNLCLQSPEERSIFIQILESAYRFTLGSIGGGKLIACTEHALFTLPILNPSVPELNISMQCWRTI